MTVIIEDIVVAHGWSSLRSPLVCLVWLDCQGGLKGTNLRGQTEPKRRFSLILQILAFFFLENEAFGKRGFSQKTADFRRKPQITAGTRRTPQIGVCPLRFVPLKRGPNIYFTGLLAGISSCKLGAPTIPRRPLSWNEYFIQKASWNEISRTANTKRLLPNCKI